MNTKNDVEVLINKKRYTLSGYESSEYLQRIAAYINDKVSEFEHADGYNRFDTEMKHTLLEINLADDYFKTQESASEIQKAKEDLEKEIFDMKHEIIELQEKLSDRDKQMEDLEKEKNESEQKAIRLEAEIESLKNETQHEDKSQNDNQITSIHVHRNGKKR